MKIIKYVVWEKKLFENYIYFCRETHTTARHCPLISSMFPRVYHSHTCHFYYSFIYSLQGLTLKEQWEIIFKQP